MRRTSFTVLARPPHVSTRRVQGRPDLILDEKFRADTKLLRVEVRQRIGRHTFRKGQTSRCLHALKTGALGQPFRESTNSPLASELMSVDNFELEARTLLLNT